jgi:hypothetical protein
LKMLGSKMRDTLASRIKGYQFNLESSKMHIIDFHQKGKATWSPRHREREGYPGAFVIQYK